MSSETEEPVGEQPDGRATAARLERLETENARLKRRLDTRLTYRRVAALFMIAAAVALGGTQVLPSQTDVLIALSGTGVFGALLLVMLMHEPLVRQPVAEAVTDSMSGNATAVLDALDIDGERRYVPTEHGDVRLYVADAEMSDLPPDDLHDLTVVDAVNYRGLSLSPTARPLVREVREQVDELPSEVESSMPVLTEAATDLFELADGVETVAVGESMAGYDTQLTVKVTGTAFGTASDIDHPITSLFGVGLATTLDRPVGARATTTDEGETLVTFGWNENGTDDPSVDAEDGEGATGQSGEGTAGRGAGE